MQDDERCCGTGTCLIDVQGHCWCGQQWDGTQMCRPTHDAAPTANTGQPAPLAPDNTVAASGAP